MRNRIKAHRRVKASEITTGFAGSNMPKIKSTFARRLRCLRVAAGFSANALALRTGISRQAYSQLELGRTQPAWETVQALAKALGLSTEEFRGIT